MSNIGYDKSIKLSGKVRINNIENEKKEVLFENIKFIDNVKRRIQRKIEGNKLKVFTVEK